jgi:hypothetical protein
MTDRDWLTSGDPLAMLKARFPVRSHDSTEPQPRYSRLYLIACARAVWDRLPPVCRAITMLAEKVYGGRRTDRRLWDEVYPTVEAVTACTGEAEDVNAIGRALVDLGHAKAADVWADSDVPEDLWAGFAHLVYFPFSPRIPDYRLVPLELHSADLLRETFGNPFAYEPPLKGEWRTAAVLELARKADEEGDFSVLPILADALAEAGCDRDDVLDHLRFGSPHACGCWALELILDGA